MLLLVDQVLCSECAYDEGSFSALLDTLGLLCTPGASATEVILCHYPRYQADGDEAEMRKFERHAASSGFTWRRRKVVGQTTGVCYELHSLFLSTCRPTRPGGI